MLTSMLTKNMEYIQYCLYLPLLTSVILFWIFRRKTYLGVAYGRCGLWQYEPEMFLVCFNLLWGFIIEQTSPHNKMIWRCRWMWPRDPPLPPLPILVSNQDRMLWIFRNLGACLFWKPPKQYLPHPRKIICERKTIFLKPSLLTKRTMVKKPHKLWI